MKQLAARCAGATGCRWARWTGSPVKVAAIARHQVEQVQLVAGVAPVGGIRAELMPMRAGGSFQSRWAELAEGGVPPVRVVQAFQVVEDRKVGMEVMSATHSWSGRSAAKRALDQVEGGRSLRVASGQPTAPAAVAALQPGGPHEPGDALAIDLHPVVRCSSAWMRRRRKWNGCADGSGGSARAGP